jgi:hypothetical protein
MTRMFRQFTGLGATLVVLSTLAAAGCGVAPRGMAPGARADLLRAKSGGYAVRFQPRPMVREAAGPAAAALIQQKEADDALADGGLKPLPKPTATAGPAAPAGPGEQTATQALHALLYRFGYKGTVKQMANAIRAKTHAFPVDAADTPRGWDPAVNSRQHYDWWSVTMKEDCGSYDDYMTQSLRVAQNKFEVVYYVWISKQEDPQNNTTMPFINLDKDIPVVKGLYGERWLAEIGPKGSIVDYLKMQRDLDDWNHLIRIPEELYF